MHNKIKNMKKLEYTEEMINDLKNFKHEDIQSTEEDNVKELSKTINREEVIKRWKVAGLLDGLEMNNSTLINIETISENELNEQPLVITNYISWLEKRINKTEKELTRIRGEKELNDATKLNLIIGKGAKLKTYKECLYYIRMHNK